MSRVLIALLFVVLPLSAVAESLGMQSDWLELVKGERCETSGAQIMGVEKDNKTGYSTVMVKVPKANMSDDPDMEEVKVVAKAPEKAKAPQLFPELETEWVDDFDNDHYGLLVKFSSDQEMPIRLYFSTGGGILDGGVDPVR